MNFFPKPFAISKKSRLIKIINEINPKGLQVALGFESSNDYIRNKLIRKKVSKKTYISAVKNLKMIGVKVFTYLLIGAPFQSVKEIEKDALASAIFAWKSGSDVINLEVYCVQAGTVWEEYYLKGQLEVLSLWSVFKIIKSINNYSIMWYLGGFYDSPKPIKVPENCSECTVKARDVFDKLVKYHEIKFLNDLPNCSCRVLERQKHITRKGDVL
jgi:radical SAM enzyme (TIGR01210 family)